MFNITELEYQQLLAMHESHGWLQRAMKMHQESGDEISIEKHMLWIAVRDYYRRLMGRFEYRYNFDKAEYLITERILNQ